MKKEFVISRKARVTYGFPEIITLPVPNLKGIRKLAQSIHKSGKLTSKAGDINAMALVNGIFHHVMKIYRKETDPLAFSDALGHLQKTLGQKETTDTLEILNREFPYSRHMSQEELLETALVVWLANLNPAFNPYIELFTHTCPALPKMIGILEAFFKTRPPFGPNKQDLLELLKAPAKAAPTSLDGQLRYIKENWTGLLSTYANFLLSALDVLKEENKPGFLGPGPREIYDFSHQLGSDYESFSPDTHWMPRLILIAKSTHVWLDQLSKTYNYPISQLDHIPDQELDQMAQQGFTGLWLIGLWERSPASQKIKQMTGNPEAIASAYSIFDYNIAEDLGGQAALDQLKERAMARGIRLAGDMVPNHMSIDSTWVSEHPEWFISLDEPPFPAYSFNGADLSTRPGVGIYLEDHYYDRSDASVVFKRTDHNTSDTRYIYHGNDGTAMPWNDTAQLDYLNPQVREAVIHTIMEVTKKFPIIRFDAAMTLTQQHFQRLWFPEPGSGGDIPSRAERGLGKKEFLQQMPQEFWRQLVDRVAQEMPDTLLLAEAFWMMEPYFVRTLGMHRVYNSAFMNFLKMEENNKFRDSIKNTLEFNPEILKRFVNFMNNPDEETAIAQFGKGDKYFGVCTLMVTLPGLPMFGHGQIEGFTEKYGMEYNRAYWQESPDPELLQRHQSEIFPLMKSRHLFAEVEHFLFYDFLSPEASDRVDHNVIAYSNCYGDKHSLMVIHNAYATSAGWINWSVPYSPGTGREAITKSLGQSLSLHRGENHFLIFNDFFTGLEYIRPCDEVLEKGLYFHLPAYGKHLFLNFRQVTDLEIGIYKDLTSMLKGKGTPSIEDALRKHFKNPLSGPFEEIVNPLVFEQLLATGDPESVLDLKDKVITFFSAARALCSNAPMDATATMEQITLLFQLDEFRHTYRSLGQLVSNFETKPANKALAFVYVITHRIDRLWDGEDWLLEDIVIGFYKALGIGEQERKRMLLYGKVLTRYSKWWHHLMGDENKSECPEFIDRFLADKDVLLLLGVNLHQSFAWYNKEDFEELSNLLLLPPALELRVPEMGGDLHSYSYLNRIVAMIRLLKTASDYSQFKLESLSNTLKNGLKPLR